MSIDRPAFLTSSSREPSSLPELIPIEPEWHSLSFTDRIVEQGEKGFCVFLAKVLSSPDNRSLRIPNITDLIVRRVAEKGFDLNLLHPGDKITLKQGFLLVTKNDGSNKKYAINLTNQSRDIQRDFEKQTEKVATLLNDLNKIKARLTAEREKLAELSNKIKLKEAQLAQAETDYEQEWLPQFGRGRLLIHSQNRINQKISALNQEGSALRVEIANLEKAELEKQTNLKSAEATLQSLSFLNGFTVVNRATDIARETQRSIRGMSNLTGPSLLTNLPNLEKLKRKDLLWETMRAFKKPYNLSSLKQVWQETLDALKSPLPVGFRAELAKHHQFKGDTINELLKNTNYRNNAKVHVAMARYLHWQNEWENVNSTPETPVASEPAPAPVSPKVPAPTLTEAPTSPSAPPSAPETPVASEPAPAPVRPPAPAQTPAQTPAPPTPEVATEVNDYTVQDKKTMDRLLEKIKTNDFSNNEIVVYNHLYNEIKKEISTLSAEAEGYKKSLDKLIPQENLNSPLDVKDLVIKITTAQAFNELLALEKKLQSLVRVREQVSKFLLTSLTDPGEKKTFNQEDNELQQKIASILKIRGDLFESVKKNVNRQLLKPQPNTGLGAPLPSGTLQELLKIKKAA